MKTFRSSLLLLIPFAYGGLLFNSDKILVNIGDIVTLDCINSLKANGIQITFNNKFVGAYEPIFSQVTNNNPSKYGVTKTLSASGYVLHLTVINFSNSDIGQYVCRDTVTVEEQSVSLDKRVQITRVTLTPANNPLLLIENRTRQIQCQTDVGRPAATVSWFKGGTNITSHAESSTVNDITISRLHLTPNKTDQSSVLFCTANNGGDVRTSAKTTLDVLYGPTVPVCIYAGSFVIGPLFVREGQVFTLNCSSSGNPAPSIEWIPPGMVTSKSLTLDGISSDNDGVFTIRAKNVLQPTSLLAESMSNTATVTVTVYYPPAKPSLHFRICRGDAIEVTSSVKVMKGHSVEITCSTSSNPPSTYRWSSHQTEQNNVMAIAEADTSHQGSYTCYVENTMMPTFGDPVSMSNSRTINITILYPPSVSTINNITVLEGLNASAQCKFKPGYPTETQIKWTRSSDAHVVSMSQTLFISAISRSQAGLYRCTALNVMEPTGCNTTVGAGNSDVFVDVQYGASITDFEITNFEGTDVMEINENFRVPFHCGVDSNPGSQIGILKDGLHQKQVSNAQGLSHVIERSKCEDDGIYTCTGQNIHNSAPVMRTLTVFVRCAPRPSTVSPPDRNVTSAFGVPAILTFNLVAYPRPNITDFLWEKESASGNGWTLMHNTKNVEIVGSMDRLKTSIIFIRLQNDDLGCYRVNVSNDLGRTSYIFHLQAQEVPDAPHNLHVYDDVTKSSVTIAWTPAVAGGIRHTFVVQYRQVSSSKWMEDVVAYDRYNHTLRCLTPGTTYELKVYAENDIGRSRGSIPIQVTTLTDPGPSDAPVIGGAVGGSIGAVVAIVVAVFILRRKYTMNCTIARKTDDPAGESVSGRNNPANKAAQTYEEVSMTTAETSVYDALKDWENRPNSAHVYTPLDASTLKSNLNYENMKNENPVYNNTALNNPVQMMP
ncbi:hemicentin-1-like isoform X2 [Mya arenaria]|uniref:hemicentin-1-like isoform X2 n=1 Tax=Mya arenaria TaxID=6604 RepID=UPI0022E953C3|nr:hemicentin-1-like isoform X2 [Mya arenaria]